MIIKSKLVIKSGLCRLKESHNGGYVRTTPIPLIHNYGILQVIRITCTSKDVASCT